MGYNLVSLMLMVAATGLPVVAGKAVAPERGVPAQFHAEWRVSLAECPPAITDRTVWINANKVRLNHSVGNVRVVRQMSKRDVTIAGELLSDGDPWDAKLRLKLSGSGNTLTVSEGDWLLKLQRCPKT